MASIGVIHNPRAGVNKVLKDRGRNLVDLLGAEGLVIETRSPQEVGPALRTLRERGIDLLAVCGGDGTIHHTLTAALREYDSTPVPPFLHLRAGTMNTVANGLGVARGTAESLLGRVLEQRRSGAPLRMREKNLIRVCGGYGFIFGCGVVANILGAYYEGGDTGPRKAAKVVGHWIASAFAGGDFSKRLLRPAPGRLSVEGEEVPGPPPTIVLASTVRDMGLHFKVAYLADRGIDQFHLMAGPVGPFRILKNFPQMLLGRDLSLPQLSVDRLVARARFSPTERVAYVVDGDLYETDGPIEITTGPRLRVVLG